MAKNSGSYGITELNVFLNNLPQNDFNSIFKTLPSFRREIIDQENGNEIECYISGTPGSFYGLFPRNSMHFMYSFTCLQWLSQVPKGLARMNEKEVMNKECTYGRKGCPKEVLKMYREQFLEDFTMFLRCRSEEIIRGGRIVLSFISSQDDEACRIMEFTSFALYKLASQGRIEKEKLERFNLNYYRPTVDQVKQLIESEGSFTLDKLHTFALSWIEIMRAEQVKNGIHTNNDNQSSIGIAISITKSFRAITEYVLASEFGEEMMDEVFHLVEEMIINNIANEQDMHHMNLTVFLTRK